MSTARSPSPIVVPGARAATWRGLRTTVPLIAELDSASRIATPAAALTPSASPLPRNTEPARAAASVAWTSSTDRSPRSWKDGMPLLCCSMGPLGRRLWLFQQLRRPELHLVAALEESSLDEILEQRVRSIGTGTELWVELARHEPRMIRQLDDLNQATVGRHAAEDHAVLVHHLAVLVVELEAVPVPLVDDLLPIRLVGRSEEHTPELQTPYVTSFAVCS